MRNLLIVSLILASCSNGKEHSESVNSNHHKELENTVRTVDLTYIAWGCQCANWATKEDLQLTGSTGDELAKRSIFIEPANDSLELPDTLGNTGDMIRFTGQFYKEEGYPKNYDRTEQEAETAKVFRYTKYQVLSGN